MKKVIVLAIVFIYLISIVVVNFFGMEIAIFEGTTYVEDITIDKITRYDLTGAGKPYVVTFDDANLIKIGTENYKLFEFPFTPAKSGTEYTADADNVAKNPNTVTLDVQVYPLKADQKGVSFIYDEKATAGKVLFYQDQLTVVFLKPDARVSLTLVAVDGSNVMSKKIYLVAKSSLGS